MPRTATKPAPEETTTKSRVIRQHVTTDPVTLVGFQAIFRPSKFGFTLSCYLPEDLIDDLAEEREEKIDYIKAKAKNPRRAVCKPEPWEETDDGFQVKFSWKEEDADSIPIVDSNGDVIDDELPLYEGSRVKLAFVQKPYLLKDGLTYGTTLKLKAIQVIEVNGGAGIDRGDLDAESAAEVFGKTKGFKVGDPNVKPLPKKRDEDDDDQDEPELLGEGDDETPEF